MESVLSSPAPEQVFHVLKSKASSATLAIETIKSVFEKKKMPVFFIFSRLDRNLLRYLLMRATELEDSEESIQALREQIFGNLASGNRIPPKSPTPKMV